MDATLKLKLRRFYTEEQIRVMELLENLGFKASSVEAKIMAEFQLEDFRDLPPQIEWMPIEHYSLLKDVLKKISDDGKEPVGPLEFISSVSKMDRITGVRICLFQFERLGWVHLVSIQQLQRTIGSILSGDGFAPGCLFAVKPRT